MTRLLVYTDLDGTLLDHHTYSFASARPTLDRLDKLKIPLVMVSSKTRKEILELRKRIGNHAPFIPENGGAIFIPEDSNLPIPAETEKEKGFKVILLGKRSRDIAPLFDRLARIFPVRALSRMSETEVSRLTGLGPDQAKAATEREFGEAFLLDGQDLSEEDLRAGVEALGLRMTRGGRFYHLLGENDKGRAVTLLTGLYRKKYPEVLTVGLGDAPNDAPMLKAVDRPFLVAGPNGRHRDVQVAGLTLVERPGPAGFHEALSHLLDELDLRP